MAKGSPAYAGMQRALFGYVQAIPQGQVVEIAALADSLNIPPRHAAYILSRLKPDEADALPWHRVIPAGGAFGRKSLGLERTTRQLALLAAEGIEVDASGRIETLEGRLWVPPQLHSSTIWADME